MNIIDFTKNGGYRLKQFTFRKMQETTIMILKAFVAFCNVPETGNYIISGCTISGANITDGWLYIDGELCKFTQSAGTLATKIKKNVVIQSLGFKNGSNENVFRFVNAVTDPTTGVALSAFSRVSPVFDPNYVHTDNNFTLALLNKLIGIQANAQVNVKPNWNQLDPTQPDALLNRPTGDLMRALYNNEYIIGDIIGDNDLLTVNFSDVGTADYTVIGALISRGNVDTDAIATWKTRDHAATNFKLLVYGPGPSNQDLKFRYYLVPNTL